MTNLIIGSLAYYWRDSVCAGVSDMLICCSSLDVMTRYSEGYSSELTQCVVFRMRERERETRFSRLKSALNLMGASPAA